MMDQLKNLFETLKEKLKASWAEQQESPLFIAASERYEQLPPIAQKALVWGAAVFAVIFVLWWPVSNLMDASDLNSKFDERRQVLKDLLRLQRDLANQPMVANPPPPSTFKPMMDGKIQAAAVKTDQIKVAGMDLPTENVSGAEKRVLQYKIDHVTIRQAIDIAYELEHTDPSLRLDGIEFTSNQTDPHYYEVGIKIANFSPKMAELPAMPLPNEKGKGFGKTSDKTDDKGAADK